MRYDLAAMAQRQGLNRRLTTFAPIEITSAFQKELAAINRKVVDPWIAATPRIVAIYSEELQRRLRQDRVDEMTSLFDQLGGEISRLVLLLTPAMQEWAFRVEKWHTGKWSRAVLAGTQVDIATMLGPQDSIETIETVLARNTALIRNVGDEIRAKVADAVFRGLQERRPPRQVGQEIARVTGLARKRANRIAADQAVKLASALDAQRQREAGLTVWKWNHSGKLHPRPEHVARDGNLYADNPADRGEGPNGETIRKPPDDLPGQLPFCGCIRQGILLLPD